MQMVRLGSSGLKVSRLCLGCVSYGTPAWRPWVLDEATSRPFFREEIEAGITFFDTANMYSLGVSEIVTGRALRDFARRDEIVLATKVYYPLRQAQRLRPVAQAHHGLDRCQPAPGGALPAARLARLSRRSCRSMDLPAARAHAAIPARETASPRSRN